MFEFAKLRANVLACQRGLCTKVPACQRAKSMGTSPTSHFYLPTLLTGNFPTLSLYKKFYIILDIIVIHIYMYCT